MDLSKISRKSILSFNSKKPPLFDFAEKVLTVAITSTTVENVLNLNKPLIVTVNNEKGLMILYPKDLKNSCLRINPISSAKYKLHIYEWRPTWFNQIEFEYYIDLLDMKNNLQQKIEELESKNLKNISYECRN